MIDQLFNVSSVPLNVLSVINVHCPFGVEYNDDHVLAVDLYAVGKATLVGTAEASVAIYAIPDVSVVVGSATVPAELIVTLLNPMPEIELPLPLSRLIILPLGALRLYTLSRCCAVDFGDTFIETATFVITAPAGIPDIITLLLSAPFWCSTKVVVLLVAVIAPNTVSPTAAINCAGLPVQRLTSAGVIVNAGGAMFTVTGTLVLKDPQLLATE